MSAPAPVKEALETPTLEELPRQDTAERADHLVLMLHGLNGNADNWLVVQEKLRGVLDTRRMLLVASRSNERFKTYEGIDACGERLAEELRAFLRPEDAQDREERRALTKLTVIGHSMGGLIARYLLGRLYSPQTSLILGLRPVHFITLATPHLGCSISSLEAMNQVPFTEGSGALPFIGPGIQRVMQVAEPFVSLALFATGRQLFLQDGDRPLLVRLTEDVPGEGLYLSALRSFATRTCYANTSGDQLVGWANASLRLVEQLPALEGAPGRGIIREDPLEAGLAPGLLRAPGPAESPAAADQDVGPSGDERGEAAAAASGRESLGELPGSGGSVEIQRTSSNPSSSGLPGPLTPAEDDPGPATPAHIMLSRLQRLPWRRVDVDFSRTIMGRFFAHNLLQVTRKWLDWEGENSAQHLAQLLAEMEADPRVAGAEARLQGAAEGAGELAPA